MIESASHSSSEDCLTMSSIGPKCYLKRIFISTHFLGNGSLNENEIPINI
jgi:hypothetical protein